MGGGGGNGCDAGQSAGLREGLLLGRRDYDDGGEIREDSDCCFFGERGFDSAPATGNVDVVVCEGGNCTVSVLGQGICTRIHETGHL